MPDHTGRVRVAIVFGGVSSEHGVSCLTAGGVTRAIDTDRFEVVGIGITPTGRWVQVDPDEMRGLEVVEGRLPRLDEARPEAVVLRGDGAGAGRVATLEGDRLVDVRTFDVAFALLHGPFGEDGTIQGLFEMLGIRYVGCGVAASANGMDKDVMKRQLKGAGLPVCPWVTIPLTEWHADRQRYLTKIAVDLTFPVYVKPARAGSSMGISRVTAPDGLTAAIEEAQRHDPKVIVEEGFVGVREIELAVLGVTAGRPRVSTAGEIQMHTDDAFYDYEAKYTPDEQVTLAIPAEVSPALLRRMQKVAAAAFTALDCEGLARVDLFVTPDDEVWVNEINTMPGFTRFSMYPSLWAASGLAYPDLIAELIQLALDRPLGLR
nr:D-alanine--D-alanine ligase [Propionibacterium sp.]